MIGWIASILIGSAAAAAVWAYLSSLKIKAGWQNGESPLARWLDNRRRNKFNMQLPEALATMSNALRAGFSISQAFDSVVQQGDAPMCEEFAILQRQLRIGMTLEEALSSMMNRVGSDDLTLVVTAILISRKTGGNITEIFDKISETIRGRMKIERKVKSLTAQGRVQGIIVSSLPFVLGLIMMVLKPKMMTEFIFSITGLVGISLMILLIVLGWLMIRKITKIDV